MEVVNIETLEIINYDDDVYECSVCGFYFTSESFKNEDQERQSRTNCVSCYHMEFEDMKALKIKTKERKKSYEYCKALRDHSKKLQFESECISTEKLIKMLQELPKNSKIHITDFEFYDKIQKDVNDTFSIGICDTEKYVY